MSFKDAFQKYANKEPLDTHHLRRAASVAYEQADYMLWFINHEGPFNTLKYSAWTKTLMREAQCIGEWADFCDDHQDTRLESAHYSRLLQELGEDIERLMDEYRTNEHRSIPSPEWL